MHMLLKRSFLIWLIILSMIVDGDSVVSYNQPKFCSSATWNPNATTLAAEAIVGREPHAIFVDTNNTVYVAQLSNGSILIWLNNSVNLTKTISGNISYPYSIFVKSNGDIYVNNGQSEGQVEKWTANTNTWTTVMSVNKSCYGLFVDTNNTLYCSMKFSHQVVKKWLNSSAIMIAAGTGTPGSFSNMLNLSLGIFVDDNFDLYVADSGNHRVQLFRPGQLNGTTIAGSESSNITITLNYPAGIVLDADKYLYIMDQVNHRIVRSGPNGFRCLVGCHGISSQSNQLNFPMTLAFDSYGNIFVADIFNNRIQKFMLATNFCNETSTSQTTTVKTVPIATNTTSTLVPNTNISTTMFEKETTPALVSSVEVISSTTDTTVLTTTKIEQPPPFFIPKPCNDTTYIGTTCNISNSICDVSNPCKNNGTCYNHALDNYTCSCPSGFNGTHCEFDYRLCRPHKCLYHGTCNQTSDRTFHCLCVDGWQGDHCESMIDLCKSSPCMNNAVCRPLVLNYTCECLGNDFYSGRHCEIIAKKLYTYKIISKSFAYIVIIALIVVAMFVVIMDILKYCFGIDPVHEDRERIRRAKKRKHPVIQRFVYTNAPAGNPTTTVEETAT